jgi:hypothetical protein
VAKSEIGFLSFIVQPLWKVMNEFIGNDEIKWSEVNLDATK